MKKTLCLLLSVLMLLSVIPITASAADEVKNITTVQELINVANDLSADYKLMNDLNLSDYSSWTPIGGSSAFTGTFEGNGKTISGLTVDITSGTTVYAGLFGNVSGTVKNLTVTGEVTVNVSGSSAVTVYAGGVVGKLGILGSIEGVTSKVTVTASGAASASYGTTNVYAGGVVGYSSSWQEISESAHFNTTVPKVTATAKMTNKGNAYAYAGGIAGYASAKIIDCYATTTVSATATKSSGSEAIAYAGGLAGHGKSFETSYSTSKATASGSSAYAGGIAGDMNGTSKNVYYVTGNTSKGYGKYSGTSDTTPTATGVSSASGLWNKKCSGFDFDGVWSSSTLLAPTLYPRTKVLSGSVSVSGTFEYGATLTADVSKITPAEAQENLKYQWYRGEKDSDSNVVYTAIDNATKSTYKLVADDVGKYVCVKVRGTYIKLLKYGYAGSASSAGKTVSKSTPAAPSAPKIASLGDKSVTLTAVSGAEYGIATYNEGFMGIGAGYKTTTWQDSNAFTGLTPETKYKFFVRIKETTYSNASASSEGTEVTTYAEGYDPYGISGEVTVTGTAKCGQKLTGSTANIVAATAGTISYTYQWYRDNATISGATALSYTVTSADIGTTLKLTVTAKAPYNGSISSDEFKVELDKPTGIAAANSADGIKLTWNAVAGAESYNIYKKGTFSWSSVATSTTNSYVVTGLTSGTTYQYTVEAVKGNTKSGYDSTGVSVKYIAAPKNVYANECVANSLNIKWDAVNGASSYTIYNGTSVLKAGLTSTSFSVDGLKKGASYSISVLATDGTVVSAKSTAVSVTVQGTSNHTYGAWSTVKDSDCKNTGSKQRTCELCGYVDTASIALKEHTFSAWSTSKSATCTVAGEQTRTCSVCQKVETQPIKATGHNMGAWSVSKTATCTEKGEQKRVCNNPNCTYFETQPTDYGHVYGDWIVDDAGSCTVNGSKHKECAKCHTVVTEVIKAPGHSYGSWVTDKSATCSVKGSKHKECTKCHDIVTEEIATVPHDYTWTKTEEATVNHGGTEKQICEDCKAVGQTRSTARLKPGKVTLGTASNVATGVKITWSVQEGADSYVIYRKLSTETWSKMVKVGEAEGNATVTFTDTTAVNETEYKYTVRAKNPSGEGVYDTTGLSVLYLETPTVTVKNGATGVTVSWTKDAGCDGYIVYRKAGSEKSWSKYATVKGDAKNSYTDTAVKSGTKYIYTVKAYDGSVTSACKSSKTLLYLAQPAVSTANASSYIKVSWKKVAGVKGYIVYRKAGSEKSWTKVKTVGSSTLSYADKDVKAGTDYVYAVKAYNGSTYSSYTATPSIRRLTAPKLSSVTAASGSITFKYGRVSGATGYYIYRKTGSGSWQKIATVKGNTRVSYVDKSVKKGTYYTYTVRAYYGKSLSAYNTTGLKTKAK